MRSLGGIVTEILASQGRSLLRNQSTQGTRLGLEFRITYCFFRQGDVDLWKR